MAGDNSYVRTEIENLKLKFSCKVIENIGSFKFIVTAYLENKTVSVKFQLTDEYPFKPPEVIVNGLDWPYHDLEQFKMANKYFSMTKFMKFIQKCLEDNRALLKEPKISVVKKVTKKRSKKPKETFENEKKVSMRTSEDVIKRIKWDPLLNPADFVIGYLDRFLGIVENNFTAFNWDDLASVDYSDTAIPKHRIHYFKYKSVIVWDKTKRIDDVFGSSGSEMSIQDVIENYVEVEEESDSNNDNECEIEIITSYQKEKPYIKLPNYFICQRLTDTNILSEIQKVQEKIISNDKSFEEFIVPQERIHMTLCTLGLQTKDDVNLLCEILAENRDELVHLSSSVLLELKKVDQFFNRVVYCKVSNSNELLTFVDHLKLIIQEKGLRICDAFDFVPHVTLMKVARNDSFKTIPSRIYEEFRETNFGNFKIDELVFCEISKNCEDDGFYKYHYKMLLK